MSRSDDPPCAICGSRSGVRHFAVTVDGKALDRAPFLCDEHGTAYLLGVGRVLGDLAFQHERKG
jgi:hypothetical protein